ncbi:MAG: hypothetical protein QOH89_43 [Pseudonocardiales bacterium]|nr:hypothetical protein [Pseudonocardiales bacterium]
MSDAPAAAARRSDAVRDLLARHRPAVLAGAVAACLAVAYLLAPLTGLDLAAQIARADFAGDHPLTPVDFRWFGGNLTFGYSLWTPQVMALVGVRLTGAICSVVATVQTTVLFGRTGAKRPTAGGVLAALAQTVNLVVGRFTFSLGMICGLGALLVLTSAARPVRMPALLRVAVLALLAGAASPVAALYLWICAGALVLVGRWRCGCTLLVASALPVLVISGVFGDGGNQPYAGHDFRDALIATLVVLVVVPLDRAVLRVGASIGLIMVVVAYVADTPVGSNASRLSQLFAVPIVAAYVAWRPWLAAVAVIAAGYPQQVVVHNWFTFGPSAGQAYYEPLVEQVRARGPLTGRVEIPDTKAHWEAAFLARAVPLARGWIRQVDVGLNETVFYDGPPTPATYRSWLAANSVQYVAVPDVALSSAGVNEVDTIDQHPSFLQPVWHDAHWRLFAVVAPVPIVGAPGRLVSVDAAGITLDAPVVSAVEINARWFRWLSLAGPDGCIEQSPDGHVRLVATAAGTYRLTSSLAPSGHC